MDLIRMSIPWSFVRQKAGMTWREILFGLEQELLSRDAPVDFATELLAGDPPAEVMDLALLEKYESPTALVQKLAENEPEMSLAAIRSKWLFLVLAWLWEHRNAESNPLRKVEEVYADFGYPPEIKDFVAYMPSDLPDLGSRRLNEEQLLRLWKAYLDKQAKIFSAA